MKETNRQQAEAIAWVQAHWNADEDGTDLHIDALDNAFEQIFGRLPDETEDAFGKLKSAIAALITTDPAALAAGPVASTPPAQETTTHE